MTGRADQLAERRRLLQLHCALQRSEVAHLVDDMEVRLAKADRVIAAVGVVARNPVLLLGGISAILILGPWRIARWLSQGAMLFGIVRRVRALVAK